MADQTTTQEPFINHSPALKGKVAIVTGASAGIGWETARILAAEGANLVVTARRLDRLEELANELKAHGTQVVIVPGDAREEDVAKNAVKAAVDTFGKLDILVNNAGTGNYKDLVQTSVEEYDEMMDTNMRSTFIFSRHAVPVMLEQREGLVVIVSSVAGLHGFAGESVYCATKFAQVGFAQALDNELRTKGIKVSLICPGGVKTEFALGRGRTEQGVAQSGMLEAQDVARAVLLACTQPKDSRILQITMRPMVEPVA